MFTTPGLTLTHTWRLYWVKLKPISQSMTPHGMLTIWKVWSNSRDKYLGKLCLQVWESQQLPLMYQLLRLPGGHIGSDWKTILRALTSHGMLTIWKVWSNSRDKYYMSTGLQTWILTTDEQIFTDAWQPYWIWLENHFTCIDTPWGANNMEGLIKFKW